MSLAAGPGRGGLGRNQLPEDLKLYINKHVAYIQSLDKRRDELDYWMTEHLRVGGIYWGLTALHLLGHPDALSRENILTYLTLCFCEDGGFAAAPGHDSHILYTCYAVQLLVTLDAVDEFEGNFPRGRDRIGEFIANLQNRETGTFAGDKWGEEDTRFMFCAMLALSLLHLEHLVEIEKCVQYVKSCQNTDGSFGASPGAESHSGQVYTCVGTLAIAGKLDCVDADALGSWLSERQLPNGGLNGRPEKLEDVCYSWWVLSSLAMIGRLHWIDQGRLASFILQCQDPENGGIADRPGDMVDVFHTVFGIAGLSLLQQPGMVEVDPI
ncbi:MAG: hypothetical protein M1821_006356 [Bathelium mastoideum]|nr:MAG: hypothetical protein M1821_006356 [Bathelium mastoideum]